MLSAPGKILKGKKTVPGLNLFIVKAEGEATVRNCYIKCEVQRGQEFCGIQRRESLLPPEEIQEDFLRKVALTPFLFRMPVAFVLGEEGKCATRDQHRPVLKQILLSKTFASKICRTDIIDTLLTMSFPNASFFLKSQPFLELFLLPGRFSLTFPSTSTF